MAKSIAATRSGVVGRTERLGFLSDDARI